LDDSSHSSNQAAEVRFRRVRKLIPLLLRARWRNGVRHGVAATVEHREVPFRDDYKTIFDVGAHHGQFTLFALEQFPRAEITCFEPQSEGVGKLRALLANEPRVKIQPFALSDAAGKSELQISERSDSSSLLPISSKQTDAHPGTARVATETIDVETLDGLAGLEIKRPSLLKIDVQGAELRTLRGGQQTLAQIDDVFVECSFVELYEGQALADEVIALLTQSGFRLAGVFSVSQTVGGECLQADFYFKRD
jgi:FkbM family methyltransferase